MTPKPDDRSTLVDPRVGDAWREASSEEPSASVDDAILAAARREVSARPETLAAWEAREVRASRRRWWPLAAAATVAAIAVGVLQLTPPDKVANPVTETTTVTDVPSPSAKPDTVTAASVSEPAAPASPPSASPPSAPKPPAAPALALTPDPFPAATRPEAESVARGAQVAASPPIPAQRAPTASPAPAPPLAKMAAASAADSASAEARTKDRKPLPVADWIELIRRLRAEGKTDEAAKELAAFRVAYPDHEKLLPPDLRDWREK